MEQIMKEKRLTICSICDDVYDKNKVDDKLVEQKVCSEECLKEKLKKEIK
jgi:hypothetical protein